MNASHKVLNQKSFTTAVNFCQNKLDLIKINPGKRLKAELSDTVEYDLDQGIRDRLADCDSLINHAREVVLQASEHHNINRPEGKGTNTKPYFFGLLNKSPGKINPEEELALRLWYEVDDVRQCLENIEGMVYNYLEDPVTFSEKMVEEKSYK